jgi:catechol-2,3-dioxygenase
MTEWYCEVFGATACYESEFVAFLRYDEEHHRFGFVQLPPVEPGHIEGLVPGLVHVAYAYDSAHSLLEQYEHMKALGEKPVVSVNHGPTISFYYKDPDRNTLELFVDRFPSMDGCVQFMDSELFHINPVGYDTDPEELLAKMKSGASEDELLHYDEALGRSINVMELAQRHMMAMS